MRRKPRSINASSNFYAKNGSVVWPDMTRPPTDAPRPARWKAAFKSTPNLYLRFEPTHIEVSESGDMASDFGVVYFKKGAKPSDTVNVGKYLVVWQKPARRMEGAVRLLQHERRQ